MATFRSVEQYKKTMTARAKAMRKAGIKSSLQAAKYMTATSISMAPRRTGETIRGITKRKVKDGYQVKSSVNGTFKQNLWANRTAPFRSVRMRWNKKMPTVYGDGSHRITGTPEFFKLSALRTREKFPKIWRENTARALKVTV